MSTSIITKETAGGGATVKNAPLTTAELDGNFITLSVNKLEASNNLSDLTDTTAAKANLNLTSLAEQEADNVSITGGTITGITNFESNSVSITGGTITGITDLNIADGGTGASTAAAARANLGVEIGVDVQTQVQVNNETSSTSTLFPTFINNTSGNLPDTVNVSDTKLTYQPSTGTLNATNFNALSDITFKENIKTVDSSLEKIMMMNPVEFNWKDNKHHSSGLIAQEIETVLPHLVSTSNEGIKSINYAGLSAYLISAMQEIIKHLNNK
jgi:hypothetical protein